MRVLVRTFTDARQLLPQLYVATDMVALQVSAPEAMILAQDLVQGDPDRLRSYRRLDLPWLTWISRRMAAAEAKAAPATLDVYRARFAQVCAWAIERWGQAAMVALRSLPDGRYRAPAAVA